MQDKTSGRPTNPERETGGVRERILDAAIEILGEFGVQQLTQVRVSKRAGVRQSHLTYYFPTRDDLLEAVTGRVVDLMANGLERALGEDGETDRRAMLQRLADDVGDQWHMRMFIAAIVEADGDPVVREMMVAATRRMESAVAAAFGDGEALERGRHVLAAVWGFGLYKFLMRPPSDSNTHFLTWLERAS